jgi:hypothetical protein
MKTQQQSAKRGAGLQSGEGSVAQRGAGVAVAQFRT